MSSYSIRSGHYTAAIYFHTSDDVPTWHRVHWQGGLVEPNSPSPQTLQHEVQSTVRPTESGTEDLEENYSSHKYTPNTSYLLNTVLANTSIALCSKQYFFPPS